MIQELTIEGRDDFGALWDAIEGGDADILLGFYSEDIELRVVEAARPEDAALELKGRADVGKYFRAVREGGASRALKSAAVYGERGVAFVEECRYPDGARVWVRTMLEVDGGLVARQTDVVSLGTTGRRES